MGFRYESLLNAPLYPLRPFDEEPKRHKSNWLRHVIRLNSRIMPKILLYYRPNGPARLGRTSKTLLQDTEKGLSRPNS